MRLHRAHMTVDVHQKCEHFGLVLGLESYGLGLVLVLRAKVLVLVLVLTAEVLVLVLVLRATVLVLSWSCHCWS